MLREGRTHHKDAHVLTAKLYNYEVRCFDFLVYNSFVRRHWFWREDERSEKKLSTVRQWSRFILITVLYSFGRLSRSPHKLLRISPRGKHQTLYSQVSIFNQFSE